MELKQNICVYIEIAGGALSPLSIELLAITKSVVVDAVAVAVAVVL